MDDKKINRIIFTPDEVEATNRRALSRLRALRERNWEALASLAREDLVEMESQGLPFGVEKRARGRLF